MALPIWIGTTNAWATGSNWSTTSAPANGDTAIFDWNAIGSLAGGDFTASNTLALLQITSLFSAYKFGDNATPAKVGATAVKIGEPSNGSTAGGHSDRINWDGSTIATTVTVFGTKASSSDTGKEPVRIKAVNASNAFNVYSGRVGVATNAPGDVATFGTITLLGSGAFVNIGSGVTLTTLRVEAGRANLNCAATTAQIDGGSLYTSGTGAITTANVNGSADLRSTGTITTLVIFGSGNVTMLNDSLAKTVTTVKLYNGAKFSYDPAVVTITNPIQLIGCSYNDVTITVPSSAARTVAVA